MNYEAAVEYLSQYHKNDSFAMMVVTEDEVRQVVGPLYEDTDQVMELISRTPGSHPDIEHNYWYDARLTFKKLIVGAVKRIRKNQIEEKVRDANYELTRELELKNFAISVDYEVRPLKKVHPESSWVMDIHGVKSQMSKDTTFAEMLKLIDRCDPRPFFEGLSDPIKTPDGVVIEAYFGS
jgi:hypothetical protein